MRTRVDEREGIKRKLGSQWRLSDIEIHIKRAECFVRMGDVAVSIGNLLSVHPTRKKEEKGSYSNKQEARRDVGMKPDDLIVSVYVWEGASEDIGIWYV